MIGNLLSYAGKLIITYTGDANLLTCISLAPALTTRGNIFQGGVYRMFKYFEFATKIHIKISWYFLPY